MANAAPRCGARSKRTGKPCRAAAMPNGRCKVHGGKSTGPRTPEGLERSRRANWKHGYYSREAKAERSRLRAAILVLRYAPRQRCTVSAFAGRHIASVAVSDRRGRSKEKAPLAVRKTLMASAR